MPHDKTYAFSVFILKAMLINLIKDMSAATNVDAAFKMFSKNFNLSIWFSFPENRGGDYPPLLNYGAAVDPVIPEPLHRRLIHHLPAHQDGHGGGTAHHRGGAYPPQALLHG